MHKDIHTFDAAKFTGVISMFTDWIATLNSRDLDVLRNTLQETGRTTASLDIKDRVKQFTRKVDRELEQRVDRISA